MDRTCCGSSCFYCCCFCHVDFSIWLNKIHPESADCARLLVCIESQYCDGPTKENPGPLVADSDNERQEVARGRARQNQLAWLFWCEERLRNWSVAQDNTCTAVSRASQLKQKQQQQRKRQQQQKDNKNAELIRERFQFRCQYERRRERESKPK